MLNALYAVKLGHETAFPSIYLLKAFPIIYPIWELTVVSLDSFSRASENISFRIFYDYFYHIIFLSLKILSITCLFIKLYIVLFKTYTHLNQATGKKKLQVNGYK